jgi:hypothetical protein
VEQNVPNADFKVMDALQMTYPVRPPFPTPCFAV